MTHCGQASFHPGSFCLTVASPICHSHLSRPPGNSVSDHDPSRESGGGGGAPCPRLHSQDVAWSSTETHHVVHGLEVKVGGYFHVGAAQGQNAQAEVEQLQGHQGDLRGTLRRTKRKHEAPGAGHRVALPWETTHQPSPHQLCLEKEMCDAHIRVWAELGSQWGFLTPPPSHLPAAQPFRDRSWGVCERQERQSCVCCGRLGPSQFSSIPWS